MTKELTHEEFVEQVLAMVPLRTKMFGDRPADAETTLEFTRKIEHLVALCTPGRVIDLIQRYEQKLAKLEAESMRTEIMREAIRAVVKEENEKRNHS